MTVAVANDPVQTASPDATIVRAVTWRQPATRRGKKPTLAQLNRQMRATHDQRLRSAEANCVRMTKRPTF